METQSGITLSGSDPVGNRHPSPEMVDHGQLVQDAMRLPNGNPQNAPVQGCADSAE